MREAVHEGSCAEVEAGGSCQRCEDFEATAAEVAGHPEPCSYTMKATAPERVEHYKTRQPECGGFWPDVTKYLAETYNLPVERVRELRDAPRDADGWPVGMILSHGEYYMLQDADGDLQEVREELATDDAIDFLVDALRARDVRSGAERGEDYASFDHAGHHFTAHVELDKEAS